MRRLLTQSHVRLVIASIVDVVKISSEYPQSPEVGPSNIISFSQSAPEVSQGLPYLLHPRGGHVLSKRLEEGVCVPQAETGSIKWGDVKTPSNTEVDQSRCLETCRFECQNPLFERDEAHGQTRV
jgi:hypothetical protein